MKLPRPDWNRYASAVHSRAQQRPTSPLGDPLKWGGQVNIPISIAAGFGFFDSNEFLRAQVNDTYSRSWALIGMLFTTAAEWALGNPAAGGWDCRLEVIQGAGQVSMLQEFDLRLLTTTGLTAYAPVFINDSFGAREGRAFAIIGGVVGLRWNGRVRMRTGGAHNVTVTVQALACPFAPGGGL